MLPPSPNVKTSKLNPKPGGHANRSIFPISFSIFSARSSRTSYWATVRVLDRSEPPQHLRSSQLRAPCELPPCGRHTKDNGEAAPWQTASPLLESRCSAASCLDHRGR